MSIDTTQPKLLGYCAALYSYMLDNSTIETDDETGVEYKVWRGHITKAAREIGIPDGTYKRVVDQLHHLKCIEQVIRGFRGAQFPTTIVLLRPPTSEVWIESGMLSSSVPPLTARSDPATLLSRIEGIERRLGNIDIVQALYELQEQVDDLKKELQASSTHNVS